MGSKKKLTAKQKQEIKVYIITGIIFFVILGFYVLHVMYLMQSQGYEMIHACEQAFNHMLMYPLVFLPFPVGYFKVMLLIVSGALFAIWIAYTSAKIREHEDPDIVAGDAKWLENLEDYNKKFTYPFESKEASGNKNIIFANEFFMAVDTEKTGRTLNTLVIGGSGVGKSFRLIGPNLMQCNTSYLVTDPSGDLYKRYAPYLEYHGYRIKVFNLDNMSKSNRYNPFRYITSDKDIEILVTMLIENTKRPDAGHGEEFWEKCEEALLSAVISYLHHFGSPDERNMTNVLRLIKAANVDENNSSMRSPLDNIMEGIRLKHPTCFTISQYDTFRLGAGKTLKSILISCAVRLKAFELDDVRLLTDSDDINLCSIADEKTAIFVIVPTGEKTFNYLAGLMYAQLFSQLYHYCENEAQYNYIFQDADGEVVKVFRAKNLKEKKLAKERAKDFLRKLDGARIEQSKSMAMVEEDDNEEFITFDQVISETQESSETDDETDVIPSGKKKVLEFWQVLDADGKLIAYRGTKKLAEEALEKMKHGQVIPATKTSQKGQRCPIHVRFLLDEFANTGKVPDFTEKLSTIRKKQISATIILQSLTQIKNMYETEWSNISANCDTTMYLGGGIDLETTEWLSTVLDTKTVRAMSSSLSSNGGSQSFQSQGIRLYSLSQLRTMPNQQCIVIPRGFDPYKGMMYDTPKHPGWSLLEKLPSYEYSHERKKFFSDAFGEVDVFKPQPSFTTPHGAPPEETAADDKQYIEAENQANAAIAAEVRANANVDGNPKAGERTHLSQNDTKQEQKEAFHAAAQNMMDEKTDDQKASNASQKPTNTVHTVSEMQYVDEEGFAMDMLDVSDGPHVPRDINIEIKEESQEDDVVDEVVDFDDMITFDVDNMTFSEAGPQN